MKEEVIEAAVVPAAAHTTGDNVANPAYSAELDALQTDAAKEETTEAAEEKEDDTKADDTKEDDTKADEPAT